MDGITNSIHEFVQTPGDGEEQGSLAFYSACGHEESDMTQRLDNSSVLCELTQSCLTLCDPMDCSPPGSSVHGILQARILGWVAISSSTGSS